jgi:hypothetical protein
MSWRQVVSWILVPVGIGLVILAAVTHQWVLAVVFLVVMPLRVSHAFRDRRETGGSHGRRNSVDAG